MVNFQYQILKLRLIMVLVAALAAGGCSILSPKPDLARNYRLGPLTAKVSPAPPPDPTLALAVFPVDIADYLDRPQMVTVVNAGQVNLDEYHRWAEPLGSGFSRVLAQDIGLLSDSSHVGAFPLAPGFGQDFEVYAQVLQFDGTPGGNVTLHVSWRITGPGGRPNYSVHQTTSTRKTENGPDPATNYVNALNGLIGDLAREVVADIPEARAAKAAHSVAAP